MQVPRHLLAAALLVSVYGASAVVLTPFGLLPTGSDYLDRLAYTIIGFLVSPPALLALWAVFGWQRLTVRWPAALWLASIYGLLLLYSEFRNQGDDDGLDLSRWLALVAAFFTSQLPLWPLRRHGWHTQSVVVRRAPTSGEADGLASRGRQISVRQLLVWTAGVGSVFALARWLLPMAAFEGFNEQRKPILFSIILSAVLAIASLPIDVLAWCILGTGRVRLRIAFGVGIAASLAGAGLLVWQMGNDRIAIASPYMIAGSLLSALMTLFVARACGCRLIRAQRNAACPVMRHVQQPSKVGFAVSLIPPLVLAAVLLWAGPRHVQLWHEADEVHRWAVQNIGVLFRDGSGRIIALWCGEGMRLTDERLREFARLSDLTSLDLSGTSVDDRQLALLLPLRKLEYLGLDRTRVTNGGLDVLSRFPRLKRVTLALTEVTDDGFDALSRIRSVNDVDVDLSWSAVTEGGIKKHHIRSPKQALAEQRKGAAENHSDVPREASRYKKKQNISISWYCCDAGFGDLQKGRWRRQRPIKGDAFAVMAKVKRLHARSQHVTDAGMTSLSSFTDLEELDLRESCITDAGLVPLAALTKLKKLDLRRTLVTKAGVERLQQSLPLCQIVPAVDVDDAVELAQAYLESDDEDEVADLAARLAEYVGDMQPVLDKLRQQTFKPVEPGYHAEEHFSLAELREKHPDDLLYFTVPESYRPEAATGLIVFMHGGGSTTSRRAPRVFMSLPDEDGPDSYQLGDVFAATGMIAVGPSAPWDEESSHRWCLRECDEYLADVIHECKSRFHIDADRVFLIGHSMGGFGAYHHVQRQPDRFAAVVANAGSWTLAYWPAIRGTRLAIVHGIHDARPQLRWHYTDIEHARWTDRLLSEYNLDHVYLEHEGEHAVRFAREKIAQFFESARDLRRDAFYPRVTLASPLGFRPYYRSPVAHNRWLTLNEATEGELEYDELTASEGEDFEAWRLEHRKGRRQGASIDAVNRGNNRIDVTTSNVAKFTVWLHPSMIDLRMPVTIFVNGKICFCEQVKASLVTTLESYRRRGDWGLIYPIKIELAGGD